MPSAITGSSNSLSHPRGSTASSQREEFPTFAINLTSLGHDHVPRFTNTSFLRYFSSWQKQPFRLKSRIADRMHPSPTLPGLRAQVLSDAVERIKTKLAYIIEYSPEAEDQLLWLTARQQSIVLDTVDRQLINQPNIETRNRRPMRPNPIAPWELRIGELRVYYEVKDEPELTVMILAVGIKERDRVRIGGEQIKL